LDETWQEDGDLGSGPGILASLWRYRFVVAAVALLAGVAGYFLSLQQPVQYRAEAALILRTPGSSAILGDDSGRAINLEAYMAREADIVASAGVLQRAQQRLHNRQPLPDFRRTLAVQPSKNLAAIVIAATAGDATSSAATANAVGKAYEQVVKQRTAQEAEAAISRIERIKSDLQDQLNAIQQSKTNQPQSTSRQNALVTEISALSQQQQDIATKAAVFGSGVELFEPAQPPDSPEQPKPKLGALLGAVLGLVGAGAWAWWAAARNQTVRDSGDAADVLQVPLLGEVPQFRVLQQRSDMSIPSPSTLGPVVVEAYHFIVASLEHALADLSGTSVVLTSAAPGDGKTTIALGVAIAAQQENRRVVLVDADVRKQRLSELCGQRGRWGLTNVEDEPIDVNEHLYCLDAADESVVLPIVPTGTRLDHPGGFFRSHAFRKVLLSIQEQADLILVDSPALLAVSDGIPIAGQVDGVVVVVSQGTPIRHLRGVRGRLAFVGTPLIGFIFNRSSGSIDTYAKEYNARVDAPRGHRLLPRLRPRRRRRSAAPPAGL
jgi:Mrp family chromosome partitioning ATPase